MRLQTASQVVGAAQRLEKMSSALYDSLADRFPHHADVFKSYSKEGTKHAKQIQRAYREVISDALETGFSFDIDEGTLLLEHQNGDDGESGIGWEQMKDIELSAIRFYQLAACQSESLMADIPVLFSFLAKKRALRLRMLSEQEQD